MNFVKGLTKLGKWIKEIAVQDDAIVPWLKRFWPAKAKDIERAEDTLDQIAGLVVKGEALGSALGETGEEKRNRVAAAAAEIVLDRLVAGRKIEDPALFRAGVARMVGGVADVLNSVDFGDEIPALPEPSDPPPAPAVPGDAPDGTERPSEPPPQPPQD